MILEHVTNGDKIKVASKNGKPVVGKNGLVSVVGGYFKGIEKIKNEVLEREFKVVAA